MCYLSCLRHIEVDFGRSYGHVVHLGERLLAQRNNQKVLEEALISAIGRLSSKIGDAAAMSSPVSRQKMLEQLEFLYDEDRVSSTLWK